MVSSIFPIPGYLLHIFASKSIHLRNELRVDQKYHRNKIECPLFQRSLQVEDRKAKILHKPKMKQCKSTESCNMIFVLFQRTKIRHLKT